VTDKPTSLTEVRMRAAIEHGNYPQAETYNQYWKQRRGSFGDADYGRRNETATQPGVVQAFTPPQQVDEGT
jgi:hypothetical protein